MSVNGYCEGSGACGACRIALMAVETCSEAFLAVCSGHGKSTCFLGCAVLKTVGVDMLVLVFDVVHCRVFLK